jgi:dihydroorotate dehydrogenase
MSSHPWREDQHSCVSAMGLSFAGPLGVAAGVDRNGEKIASLRLAGFGHIEIGTITAGESIKIGRRAEILRVGVNIGSSRSGLDEKVVADYSAVLRQVYCCADYLCANLTSPRSDRDGNSRGVDRLIGRLKAERNLCAAETGRRAPLLVKVDGGEHGDPFPVAIIEAQRQGLDGIVVVCSCLRRIAAIKRHMDSMTLISVGGIATARQARARIDVGAALVQVHKAFVENRVASLCRVHDSAVHDGAGRPR